MALHYLDLETTGLDPAGSRILTIQTQRVDGADPGGPLVIHKSWERGGGEAGERAILEEFVRESAFFSDAWNFVPVGFNLRFELSFLIGRCLHHRLLALPERPRGADWFEILRLHNLKPQVDVHPIAVLMNGLEFKGASLQNFSPKPASGNQVLEWAARGDWAAVEEYIRLETDAFFVLWRELATRFPRLWREELAPLFHRSASPPGPPTPGL